jgi:hypothetical protein
MDEFGRRSEYNPRAYGAARLELLGKARRADEAELETLRLHTLPELQRRYHVDGELELEAEMLAAERRVAELEDALLLSASTMRGGVRPWRPALRTGSR